MEIYLLNTFEGLKPLYDEDYESKKKLKLGQVYKANIKVSRNIKLHRKYFSLINTAWELQNEKTQKYFKDNVDVFRKTLEVAAGHCDKLYSLEKKEWYDVPKSIAFDKIDEIEFQDIYNNVKNVILEVFLKNTSEDEFNKILENYG